MVNIHLHRLVGSNTIVKDKRLMIVKGSAVHAQCWLYWELINHNWLEEVSVLPSTLVLIVLQHIVYHLVLKLILLIRFNKTISIILLISFFPIDHLFKLVPIKSQHLLLIRHYLLLWLEACLWTILLLLLIS